MKTVCPSNQCTGCMACLDACTQNAIKIDDSLWAYNAVIDESKCVNCGVCTRVCPVNIKQELRLPKKWFQGWAVDEQVRSCSSSGGAATALALEFVRTGGVVCSCTFVDGKFVFRIASTPSEVRRFSGSKYVKSAPGGAFRQVKSFLLKDVSVLFIGLPCQVAAMRNYVGHKLSERLYTVDLICHGTPSPKILERFLGEHRKAPSSIQFRKKTSFQVYCDGETVSDVGEQDPYIMAFLKGLSYTENCYSCRYANVSRVSDITLGDAWGSDLPQVEQSRGVSLILCQTEKGVSLVEKSPLLLLPVELETAVAGNAQLRKPAEKPELRGRFLSGIEAGDRLSIAIARCYPKMFLKVQIKRALRKLFFWKNAQ